MRKPVKQEEFSNILRDRLLSGYYPRDKQLPDERKLAEEFGISRKTLRSALARLDSENLLRRYPRRGTYVHLGESGQENFCYYVLPCHDFSRISYPSIAGHLRLMSGVVQACAARQAECVMLPMSNDNNPEHLLAERLDNLPQGARLILPGAYWYQSIFPQLARWQFRIVMYHIHPEGDGANLPDRLFIGYDGAAFIRAGVDFLKKLGCVRPLFVTEKQENAVLKQEFPVVRVTSSDPREITLIRKAFFDNGCDSVFCETFPHVTVLWSLNSLLEIPERVPFLVNDNLMDFSCMAKPPHLIGFDIQDMTKRGIDFLFSDASGGNELCSRIIFKQNKNGGTF